MRGRGEFGAQGLVLEMPIGHDVPIAQGLIDRADEGLARFLHKPGHRTAVFHAESLVDEHVLLWGEHFRPLWPRQFCRLLDEHLAFENMDEDVLRGRHIDGKFGAQVND